MFKEPRPDITANQRDKEQMFRAEFNRSVPDENMALIKTDPFFHQPGAFSFSENLGRCIIEGFPPPCDQNISPANQKFDFNKIKLQPQANFFRKLIADKDFFDMGCGIPNISTAGQITARALGAKRYIGVDVDADSLRRFFESRGRGGELLDFQTGEYPLQNTLGPALMITKDGFDYTWIQDDMLGFMSKKESTNGAVFFFGGIQEYSPTEGDEKAAQLYLDALANELHRITHSDDVIIFSHMPSFIREAILKFGFKEIVSAKTRGLLNIFIKE